jgi:hypothetical protein
MISLTSKTGSSQGVIFQEAADSKLSEFEPRLSKAKALDGRTIFDHRGLQTGDRELEIKAKNLSEETTALLEALVENETFVNLSCKSGFFEGAISRLSIENGNVDIIFWVRQ